MIRPICDKGADEISKDIDPQQKKPNQNFCVCVNMYYKIAYRTFSAKLGNSQIHSSQKIRDRFIPKSHYNRIYIKQVKRTVTNSNNEIVFYSSVQRN